MMGMGMGRINQMNMGYGILGGMDPGLNNQRTSNGFGCDTRDESQSQGFIQNTPKNPPVFVYNNVGYQRSSLHIAIAHYIVRF